METKQQQGTVTGRKSMKYLRQFLVILGISFLGELCHRFIPAPIPASIYGMVMLFLLLWTGILKLDGVKETGHFLVDIMAVLFVCPAVGLLDCWDVLRENWAAIFAIVVVSFLITFGVSGAVTQYLLKKRGEGKNG